MEMLMRECKEQSFDTAAKKERIRSRYRGIDTALLDVIPARAKDHPDGSLREKRVGVYARVSTDDPRQTSSYELQRNHYQDLVQRHAGWRLAEIYADEGISGTSLQHRDAFLRMIADCRDGKLDLIVTKSVSRFARNVVDCIRVVRELKELKPPVGVFFETENIFTLNPDSEMSLSFLSTLAQEESHNKSEIMNASIEMRFKRGIFLTPPLLGYDQDADGNLVVNEEEAKTVRFIFSLYLYGHSCRKIAALLERLNRPTKKGVSCWSEHSVLNVLQNERHCGDVLARKTWTPNYLDHRSKKNRFDRNQYLQKNHHAAIISRGDFIAAQQQISNARYGGRNFLPHPMAVSGGVFDGYVLVNPRWAGFTADDYRLASRSAHAHPATAPGTADTARPDPATAPGTADTARPDPATAAALYPAAPCVTAPAGSFDLRGYETVSARLFDMADQPAVVFSSGSLRFNAVSVRSFFRSASHAELLIHPDRLSFAVRPCPAARREAVRWASVQDGDASRENAPSGDNANRQTDPPGSDICRPTIRPRPIGGRAFLPVLFSLCRWDPALTYRITGTLFRKGNEEFLLFDLHDAHPAAFGEAYYDGRYRQQTLVSSVWESRRSAGCRHDPSFGVSTRRELRRQILALLAELRKDMP